MSEGRKNRRKGSPAAKAAAAEYLPSSTSLPPTMTSPKANRAAETLKPAVMPLGQYLKGVPTLTLLLKAAVEVAARRPLGRGAAGAVAEAVEAEAVVAVVPPVLALPVKPCDGTVSVAF